VQGGEVRQAAAKIQAVAGQQTAQAAASSPTLQQAAGKRTHRTPSRNEK
jgi:hypothetical protein